MLEIFVNMPKDSARASEIKEGVEKLCKNGWAKFGNNGFLVLFKDVSLDEGRYELDYLGLEDVEVEEWDEN